MAFPPSPVQGEIYNTIRGEIWEFDGNGWIKPTVNLKMITSDRTFLIGSDFATLNDAMDGLSHYYINPGVTVTIQLSAGLHTLTKTITGHNSPGRVRIKGAAGVSFPGAGSWAVTGSNSGGIISSNNGHRDSNRSDNHTMCMSAFPSQIWANGFSAFTLDLRGTVDIIEDVYIYGNSANLNSLGVGIEVASSVAILLSNVVVGKFNIGIRTRSNGRINMVRNAESGVATGKVAVFGCNSHGVVSLYGSVWLEDLASYGNGGNGVDCSNNGFVACNNGRLAGNGGDGVNCYEWGYVECSGAVFHSSTNSVVNSNRGIFCKNASVNANGANIKNHSGTSLYANRNGFIDFFNGTGTGTTFSPTANTTGNSRSYINTTS